MNAHGSHRYAFGEFLVDSVVCQLRRSDGTLVALTPRVFDTLLHLVRHPGALLGKDELMAAVWPDRIVEENNLTRNIPTLRKALGTEADGQRCIVTESGRGYRFVADVRAVPDEAITPEISLPAAASDEASMPGTQTTHRPGRTKRSARAFVLAGVLLIGLLAAGTWFARPQSAGVVAMPIATIAVLPFKPLSSDNRDEVLEPGMADTLIAKLSSSRRLLHRTRRCGSRNHLAGARLRPALRAHGFFESRSPLGSVARRSAFRGNCREDQALENRRAIQGWSFRRSAFQQQSGSSRKCSITAKRVARFFSDLRGSWMTSLRLL
jgi:DNA-binding winged helix-turn-helix (wHTH) protein